MIKIQSLKYFFLLLILFECVFNVKAQVDPAFSQSYANALYLSPSFTGLTNGSRVALSYRDQWPGIPNAYKSFSFSFDHFLNDYSSGIGMLLLRDDEGGGMFVKQTAGALYSYELEVSRTIFVRPGIQFKYSEQKMNLNEATLPTGDLGTNYQEKSYQKFDATVSGMIYSDYFWFGFTVDHLIKSNVGYSDIETHVPIKTIVYGGYKYKYREGYRHQDEQSVTLAMNYFRQQDFQQLDMGAYWYINPMELGLLYRGLPFMSEQGLSNVDALVIILGINFGPMRFAYSYDLTMSNLAGVSNGANEVSFIYRFNHMNRNKGQRGALPCGEPGVQRINNRKYSRAPRKML